MASLVGKQLKDTYDSLLKTSDNDALGGTYKEITDGAGNGSNLYLGTGGNVGIGISPAEKLDIVADSVSGLKIGTNSEGGATLTTYQGSTNSNVRQFEINCQNFEVNTGSPTGTSTSNAFLIDSSGNVGIGITNPSDYFTNFNDLVVGSTSADSGITIASSTTDDGTLAFADGTSGTAEYSGYIQYSHGTDELSVGTAGGERLRIDSSGNVGIGTTSPGHPLTVTANPGSADTPVAWIHNSGNATSYDGTVISTVNDGSDVEVLHVRTNNTTYANGTSLMLVRGDGHVGIGTDSPDGLLNLAHQTSTSSLSDDASGYALTFNFEGATNDYGRHIAIRDAGGDAVSAIGGFDEGTGGATALYFATGNTTSIAERMRINSSGTVLIGKTADGLATVGTSLFGNGTAYHTVNGGIVQYLNRTTSDGSILEFRKDNATVGSIGTYDGDIIIGTGTSRLRFYDATPSILPTSSDAFGASDNAIDLGNSGRRFKDLYLGGSVGIGGTSIGAKLDIQGTDTEPLTVLNDTVYTFAANVTTSQSNTHTVTIPFTSQVSQYSNFLVEIYASLTWVSNSQIFAGRALYTFTTLNSIGTIAEIEDIGQNLSFSATSSGMNFVVTITTTGVAGQEPSRIGVMAKVIRSNGSVGNEPTSMTIA